MRLNNDAVIVLRERKGINDKYVFTNKNQAIKKANGKAYRNALARAGIKDFTWPELRHSWASWHLQAGTPLMVLQKLGGIG